MTQFRPMQKMTSHKLTKIATLITGALALITVAAFGSRVAWFFDLLTLFHFPYLIMSALLVAFWFVTRRWGWMLLALLLVLLNGSRVLPYFLQTPTVGEGETLRIYMHNIYYQNQNLTAIRANVDAYDPDIIFLMEYSDGIQREIEQEFADYPYHLIQPSRMTMGLALFSKYPFSETAITQDRGSTRIPVFEAVVAWEGQSFNLVMGHPWPPAPQWGALHRRQIEAISAVAERQSSPLIVMGDFNASQWAYPVREMLQSADLRDARQSFGLDSTWFYRARWLGLMLDHLFVSAEWHVANYQLGERGGSDHTPIIVDLQLPDTD